ncbi:hypothetical protein TWF694_008684 [Orbilia ellipsospora]|uniref:UspA domain-containing protein n=1 Tax=Orbilia ellipsospora TaxID=2528407 RepID=A0AAV9XJ40_9PEZI
MSSPSAVELSPRDQANSTDSSDAGSLLSQKVNRPSNDARRPSAIAFAEPEDPRRPSIQFKRDGLNGTASVGSGPSASSLSADGRSLRKRSLSSPPPPPTFIKRVGFDTFNNKDATDFALTLKSKHKDYKFGRGSRTFLCGTDQNDYSTIALEWLLEELVDDNDEIVCLRVVDKDSKMATADPSAQEKLYRLEADKLMQTIITKNDDDKAVSIVLEFCVGKVHDTFQRMINLYEPVMLIVGTRGRSLGGFQGLLPGSVSKYCLQHSPVPVIVVRPNEKRERKKRKRQDNPARRTYLDIMNKNPLLSTIDMMHSNSSLSRASADTTPSSTPAPRESTTSVSEASTSAAGRNSSKDSVSEQPSSLTEVISDLKISSTHNGTVAEASSATGVTEPTQKKG